MFCFSLFYLYLRPTYQTHLLTCILYYTCQIKMLTILTILRTVFAILPNYAGNQPLCYSDDDTDRHHTYYPYNHLSGIPDHHDRWRPHGMQRRVDFLFLICRPRRSALCINDSTTDFRHTVPAVVPVAEFGIVTADDMPPSRLLIVSYYYTAVAHNNIIHNIYIASARGR